VNIVGTGEALKKHVEKKSHSLHWPVNRNFGGRTIFRVSAGANSKIPREEGATYMV